MTKTVISVARPIVGEEEVQAVREVLLSGNYTSGHRVSEFEEAFATYIGTRHAVAVSNGTAALYIALEAMGVRKNDEVVVAPITFFASISAVLYIGATPVFCDIDLDDLCLSYDYLEGVISPKTKAIMPVHLYGASAKMDPILDISNRYDIPVLEDCAQSHGTKYKDKVTGSMGRAGAFSFFATKHMTTGEGGMITTNDTEIAETARILRSHGMSGRDDHVLLGYNNRMTEMEAAMGLVQLRKLDDFNRRRIQNSEYILEQVAKLPWAYIPVNRKHIVHTYFWCPVMVRKDSGKTIDDLKELLRSNGIGFRMRYQEPLYKQPVLKQQGLDYSDVYLPNVEKIAGKVIGLPNHPELTELELDTLINVLSTF